MLRAGITVRTADDPSYLAPAENFLSGKGWISNAVGDAAYTTRTPGYGLLYLTFRAFFSVKTALILLVSFQILLFAFAVSRIPQMGLLLNLPLRLSVLCALFIAVMPTFSGFLSYTLTEGVIPALVLLFLYRLLLARKGAFSELIKAIFLLALVIFIRPAMLVWMLAPLILIWKNALIPKKGRAYLTVLLALTPLFIWQAWASAKTHSWVGLHPIYHSDSNDLYRPVHRDIWNFQKSWGQRGVDFHLEMTALWQDALTGASPQATIDKILASTDENALIKIGSENLRRSYHAYYEILLRQAPYYKNRIALPGITPEEAQLSKRFQAFRDAYVAHHFFYSNLVVPAQVYWRLASHSNLSLFIFQRPFRGNGLMEIFRFLSFLVYCGSFLLFPFAWIYKFKNRTIQMIGLPILAYLGFLCLIQRGIEARYSAPVLIPMVWVVLYSIYRFYENYKRRLRTVRPGMDSHPGESSANKLP